MTIADQDGIRNEMDMLVRAAESYYLENKTQAQIAAQLGISASTISRLLTRAREEGIVKISIVRPHTRNTALEHSLCLRFGLDEAVVVSTPPGTADEEVERRLVGVGAGAQVDALIKPGMVIGVGRGRSLAALAGGLEALATPRQPTIVQVLGEYDTQHSSARSAEITRHLAEMYSGISYYLNAPALVDDPTLARLLLATPGVSPVLSFYDRLDMVLLGVGPLRGSPLELNGTLTARQLAQLEAVGAVGDICGHFFTEDGSLIDSAYAGQVIGMSWQQLQQCPCVVAIACGVHKASALRALLRARLLNFFITDEQTAQQIVGPGY